MNTESDERMNRIEKTLDKITERQAKTDAQIAELKESQAKTDAQLAKTDAQLDRLGKYFGDSENNKGQEVEDFFYRHFAKHRRLGPIKFDEVNRNIISSEESEHDIVMINGEVSALISVKYKLKKEHIDYLVDTELNRIRSFYHRLGSKHKLFGGMAAYIIPHHLENYARAKGVFLFGRAGDNVQALNHSDFKPQDF